MTKSNKDGKLRKKPGPKKGADNAGRPPKAIDYEMVKRLATIQCTDSEIAACLDMHQTTFTRRMKEDEELSQLVKKHREEGKKSLRRAQFAKAVQDGNATMQIWLGKQYLGQSDKQEVSIHQIQEQAKLYAAERGLDPDAFWLEYQKLQNTQNKKQN